MASRAAVASPMPFCCGELQQGLSHEAGVLQPTEAAGRLGCAAETAECLVRASRGDPYGGIYGFAGDSQKRPAAPMFQGLWLSMTGSKKLGNIMATAKKADLFVVKELLETGKIKP